MPAYTRIKSISLIFYDDRGYQSSYGVFGVYVEFSTSMFKNQNN